MSGSDPVKVSVRNLIALTARAGDLGGGSVAGPTAQQGMAGHQWFARQKDSSWQSEVALTALLETPIGALQVSGRADFVCTGEPGEILVEEVKTCLGDPARGFDAAEHWAQAQMYAFLYARQYHLPDDSDIAVRLTRLDLLQKKTHSKTQHLSIQSLSQQCHGWALDYLTWQESVQRTLRLSLDSAEALTFPFDHYRPHQHDCAQQVYRCARDHRHLLLQAPTGSGKTLSVCFPVVKALGAGCVNRVLYLTCKGSSQNVVLDGLKRLQDHGLQLSMLQISAKRKVCPCENEGALQADECERCVGYYDRLPAARAAALNHRWLDTPTLLDIAHTYQVCPFEFALEMVPWAQWVVCDVNYWFDPVIRLSVLEQGKKTAVLIDEVHNLSDRVRAMYSAGLSTAQLKAIKTYFEPMSLQIERLGKKTIRLLKQLAGSPPLVEKTIAADRIQDWLTSLTLFLAAVDDIQMRGALGETQSLFAEDVGTLVQPLRRFAAVAETLGLHHVVMIKADTTNGIMCELHCLNGASFIESRRQEIQSQIGFSATLEPWDYVTTTLGFNNADELQYLQVPSSFPPDNRKVVVVDSVNTRWQNRAQSLPELIAVIDAVLASHRGNYLLFLPSFDYIDQLVSAAGEQRVAHWLLQPRAATEAQRAQFIQQLIDADSQLLAVAVLGGTFAEAMDLPQGILAGVIVVGTGMAQPSLQNKTLQQYWQNLSKNGFDYSFRWPGFTRVLQAAGRVVRSDSDKGVVVLIDDRYQQPVYQTRFPEHWQVDSAHNAADLFRQLQLFWTGDSNGASLEFMS